MKTFKIHIKILIRYARAPIRRMFIIRWISMKNSIISNTKEKSTSCSSLHVRQQAKFVGYTMCVSECCWFMLNSNEKRKSIQSEKKCELKSNENIKAKQIKIQKKSAKKMTRELLFFLFLFFFR